VQILQKNGKLNSKFVKLGIAISLKMAKTKRNAPKTPKPVKSGPVKSAGKWKTKFSTIFSWAKKVLFIFFIGSIGLTLMYRFVDPFLTPLMMIRTFQQVFGPDKVRWKHDWVDMKEMSPFIPKATLAAEDQKFFEHNGFDFDAMWTAFNRNQHSKKLRGGSTISQQTAKNVFLWPGRSYVRKVFEAYFTLLIELLWPKERILEVYLNVIEMGRGVYGAEAASRYYYGKSCRKLSKAEAAAIASVFPLPLKWNPLHPSANLARKQQWIRSQIDVMELPRF